jgi:cob(I)alamin adenosyltransferase
MISGLERPPLYAIQRLLMKIYTGTGDLGETSLFSGQRVRKTHPRVAAYGTLDEMNSVLGAAVAAGPTPPVRTALLALQAQTFDLCADLATVMEPGRATRITQADIGAIENEMDRITAILPEIKKFALPGGTPAACQIHIARTVARRAEREALEVENPAPVARTPMIFLNRLSDYLYLLARYENHLAGAVETDWIPKG